MSNKKRYKLLLLSFVIACSHFVVSAQLRLPKLVSDGMVLQRGIETSVWGWSDKGDEVTVKYKDAIHKTIANSNGEWKVTLPKQKAGGPYVMQLSTINDTLRVRNIMVGDVWLCSGQSNMELPMRRVSPIYGAEIAQADNRNIRYFETPKTYDFSAPQSDLKYGKWVDINSESIHNISAVAYFFSKKINAEYNVPVGIINSSLGGSPAQAWLSEEALINFPDYYAEAQTFKNQAHIDSIQNSDKARMNEWYHRSTIEDGGQRGWEKSSIDDSDWKIMNVPGYWANTDLGYVNGVVWFRKEVEIPEGYSSKEAMIILGCIVDADSVFINGKFVGTTGYQYPPRRYKIPAGVLLDGKNTIAIRVISNSGRGGFVENKDYEIVFDDKKIDLNGSWKYKLGVKMESLRGETFIRWKAGGLYNAMIAPVKNYAIKGALWYQGESNAGKPREYENLLTSLIGDWRKQWKQGDFPFLFVQLANFMAVKAEPGESGWAMLRENQRQTLKVPNTGMAVIIDVGEGNDIHPLNKKDVGERLALAAQKIAYGEKNLVHSGPSYQSMKVKGNKIVLTFENIGSGMKIKDGEVLKEFAIAGADKKFVWANAIIKKNKISVWNDKVPKPVAVRYAWADNPDKANLYNKEGLPASPFRTDNW